MTQLGRVCIHLHDRNDCDSNCNDNSDIHFRGHSVPIVVVVVSVHLI